MVGFEKLSNLRKLSSQSSLSDQNIKETLLGMAIEEASLGANPDIVI